MLSDEQAKEVEQILLISSIAGSGEGGVVPVVAKTDSSVLAEESAATLNNNIAGEISSSPKYDKKGAAACILKEGQLNINREHKEQLSKHQEDVRDRDINEYIKLNNPQQSKIRQAREEEEVDEEQKAYQYLQQNVESPRINYRNGKGNHSETDNGSDGDDDRCCEDLEIVGIGTTVECISSRVSLNEDELRPTAAPAKLDDDEPEWLRDVLEAPKRSLENLLILHSRKEQQEEPPKFIDDYKCSIKKSAGNDNLVSLKDDISDKLCKQYSHTTIVNDYEQSATSAKDNAKEDNAVEEQKQHSSGKGLSTNSNSITQNNSGNNKSVASESPATAGTKYHSPAENQHNKQKSVENDSNEEEDKSNVQFISDENDYNHYSANSNILDESQYYIPEYPPVRSREVLVEGGVHYFEDGNFWMEVPGKILTHLLNTPSGIYKSFFW